MMQHKRFDGGINIRLYNVEADVFATFWQRFDIVLVPAGYFIVDFYNLVEKRRKSESKIDFNLFSYILV